MKKSLRLLISLLFLFIYIISVSICILAQDPYWYQPRDIKLDDNNYKETTTISLQWWYLDASFNNSYSTHIGFLTIGAYMSIGFFLIQMQIYENGSLMTQRIQLLPLRFIEVSTQEPVIRYKEKEVFRSYLDQSNHLNTKIQLNFKDLQVDLLYTGITKGWIGTTGLGWWGCPLPKAKVIGNLTINGNHSLVEGFGYQERGWDVTRLHQSWFWGKCSTKNMNLVFSQNMQNRYVEDVFIAVVNNPSANYSSIHRENITFIHTKYTRNHGRLVPIESLLVLDEDPYIVQVRLHVKSIDYKTLLFMHYWRFHVNVTGTIVYNNSLEEINEIQIMEVFHRI